MAPAVGTILGRICRVDTIARLMALGPAEILSRWRIYNALPPLRRELRSFMSSRSKTT